jgi:chemotaxis signal transduction protein
VFRLADESAAVPLENVQRIAPMARLARAPASPSALEGFLNWGGTAVAVLRLDRLLQLPEQQLGLYSMLIILKGVSDCQTAMLVDRVSEVVSVSESRFLPVPKEHSFNACAEAAVLVRGQMIHLLSPSRILLEMERRSLDEFQTTAQRRLRDWDPEGK